MIARDAARLTLEAFPDAVFVCANGYLSREVFGVDDRPSNFYMIGSMGLTASIALGIALVQPRRRVVAFDGDGNVLMALGALALIGSQKPANLFHVCVDNGVYASTGNQPTIAPDVSLDGIAREAGYPWTREAATEAAAAAALAELASTAGPGFLRLRVDAEPHPREFERVALTPVEMRARLSTFLGPDASS